MSYIQSSLGQNEHVIARARFHWWYTLKAWIVLITTFWLLGLGIYYFFKWMITKWTTEIGVTNHRFIKKSGWISIRTDEMAIHNIEGVKLTQSFWGRVLGFGKIRIEGTGVDAIELPTIRDPIVFRAAIESAKEEGPQRP